MGSTDRQRGQAVPLVAVTLFALALAAAVIVNVAARADEVARARSAADAAALAGTRHGAQGAARLAAANGATLIAFSEDTLSVQVTVRVGGSIATAQADLVARLPP